LALLRDINKTLGITIVVITHELKVVWELCGRVAVLDNAGVAEIGATREVFDNPRSPAARALINTDGAAVARLARLLEERGLTAEEVMARVQTG
jgi:D-methionine transport system ATP-binding protein